MNRKGFTLVELITVVVIMGILALIVIPNTTRLLNAGKKEQMITDASTLISKAKYEYKMSNETSFDFTDYLKDKTDGFGDSYITGSVKYEDNAYKVDIRTSNHCLSNTKDGKCDYIEEKNIDNAYVVEVNNE